MFFLVHDFSKAAVSFLTSRSNGDFLPFLDVSVVHSLRFLMLGVDGAVPEAVLVTDGMQT